MLKNIMIHYYYLYHFNYIWKITQIITAKGSIRPVEMDPTKLNMAENNKTIGNFVSFVLLSEPEWDGCQFIRDLKEEWGIDFCSSENDKDTMVEALGDGFAAVSFIPVPIPNGEAEDYSSANYMWPEATDVVKSHKAQILIAITGNDSDMIGKAKMTTKLIDTCLKQKNAIAVYADGAVYQPDFYHIVARSLHEDQLPILDWVWFGIYKSDKISGIYTYGLRKFGKEEIEVYANANLNDIRDFVMTLASYVLEYDVTLKNGETIGFSEDEKLPITLSNGIALDGETLKIQYPEF